MDEERKKKIQAGKERLAAFQKKRARKKKPKDVIVSEEETISETISDTISEMKSSLCSLDTLNFSSAESQSTSYDSDQVSMSSSGELSSEEFESSVLSESMRKDLILATQRITELEESLMGKQMALDRMIEENKKLKISDQRVIPDRPPPSHSNGQTELSAPFCDMYLTETQQLMEQVQVLQMQLQKAGQVLNMQMSQHQISAQALMEAKNQMLGLQDKILQKDQKISQLERKMPNQDPEDNTKSKTLLESAKKDIENLKAENLALTEKLKFSSEKTADLIQADNEKLSEQVDLMSVKETELLMENEALKQNLDMFAIKDAEITSENKTLKEQLNRAINETDILQAENTQVASENARLKEQLNETKNESNVFQSEIGQLSAENKSLKERLNEIIQEADDLRLVNGDLKEKVDFSTKETESLKEQLSVLQQEMSSVKFETSSIQQAAYNSETENILLLKEEVASLKEKLELYNEEEISIIKSENEILKQRLDTVNLEETEIMKAEIESLKSKLDSMNYSEHQWQESEHESLKLKLDLLKAEETEVLKSEINSLKQELHVLKFEEMDLMKSENETLKQRLEAVTHQETEILMEEIRGLRDELNSSSSHGTKSVQSKNISVSPGVAHYGSSEISESPEESIISHTTEGSSETDLATCASDEYVQVLKADPVITSCEDINTEKSSQLISVSVEETVACASSLGDIAGSHSDSISTELPSVEHDGAFVESDEMLREDSPPVQSTEGIQAAVISDIESRLRELETLNAQLKTEKEQLLRDFEGLMSSLELLKVAEDEKEKAKEKLEIELENANSEIKVLGSAKQRSETEVESVKLKMEMLVDEKSHLMASLTEQKSIFDDQNVRLNSELEKCYSELSRIKTLIATDEAETEYTDVYQTLKEAWDNRATELDEAIADKEQAENRSRDLEMQLDQVLSERKLTDINLQELTLRLAELTEENELMSAERASTGEQIEGLRGQLMEAENELQDLRYESQTMQSFMTDVNQEKETLVRSKENWEATAVQSEDDVIVLRNQLEEVLKENDALRDCVKEKDKEIETYEADNTILQESISTAEQEVESLKLQNSENEEKDFVQQFAKPPSDFLDEQDKKLEHVKNFLDEMATLLSLSKEVEQNSEFELGNSLKEIQQNVINMKSELVCLEELETERDKLTEELEQSESSSAKYTEQLGILQQSYNNLEKQLENNLTQFDTPLVDKLKSENETLSHQLSDCHLKIKELNLISKDLEDSHLKLRLEKEAVSSELNVVHEESRGLLTEISAVVQKVEELEVSNKRLNDCLHASEARYFDSDSLAKTLSSEREDLSTKLLATESKCQLVIESLRLKDAELNELELKLQESNSRLLEESEMYRSSLTEIQDNNYVKERGLEESQSIIVNLTNQLEKSQSEVLKLSQDMIELQDKLEENVSSLKEELLQREEELINVRAEISNLQQENASQFKQVEALTAERDSLQKNLDDRNQQDAMTLTEKDQKITELLSDITSIQTESESLKVSNEDLNRELTTAKQEIEDLKFAKEDYNNRIVAKDNQLLETNMALESERKISSTLQTDLEVKTEELKSTKDEANAQIKDLEANLRDTRLSLSEEKQQVEGLKAELDAGNTKLKDMYKKEEELLGQISSLQEEVTALRCTLDTERASSVASTKELDVHRQQLSDLHLAHERMSQSLTEVETVHKTNITDLQTKLYDSAELMDKNEELEDEVNMLRNENEKLCSKSQSLMNEIEYTRSQHESVLENIQQEFEKQSQEFINLQSQVTEVEKENEKLQKRISQVSEKFEEDLASKERQVKSIDLENTQLKEEKEELNQQLQSAISRGIFFENQISSFESQITMLNSTAEALREDKSKLLVEFEALKSETSSQDQNKEEAYKLIHEENTSLKEQLHELGSEIVTLKEDKETLDSELKALQVMSSNDKVANSDSEEAICMLKEEIVSLRNQLEEADICAEKLRKDSDHLAREVNMLYEEKSQSRVDFDNSIEIFKDEINNLQDEISELKKEKYAREDEIQESEKLTGSGQLQRQSSSNKEIQTDAVQEFDAEMKDLLAERDKLRDESTDTADEYQKLLTEYQTDVEALKSDLDEKMSKEQDLRDELELTKRKVKILTKENRKIQAMYEKLAMVAEKLGFMPDEDSSQASTEVEDFESEDDEDTFTDDQEDLLQTLRHDNKDYHETEMGVLVSHEKQVSLESDKMSLTESIQEEDAEIQAQYQAMLHDSSPRKGDSGITYTEEEYEEKLKSLAAKFENEFSRKEEYIRDQHAMKMERMRIEMEYDFRMARDEFEKDRTFEYNQKVEAYKVEKELEFVGELRKARQEIQKVCDERLHQQIMPHHLVESGTETTDELERLRLENQELGEARDALLQQLNDSPGRQEHLEDILHPLGASPSVLAESCPKAEPPSFKEMAQNENVIMPLHLEPEGNVFEAESDTNTDWQPETDTMDLRNTAIGMALGSVNSLVTYSDTGELFIECDQSEDEADSLDGDFESKFTTLQTEHDELLVKANELEEQVFKMSSVKDHSSASSEDSELSNQIMQLQMERETLQQKVKNQRELFAFEKSELQQKCSSLSLELETVSLFKSNLEQELESMTEALNKKDRKILDGKDKLMAEGDRSLSINVKDTKQKESVGTEIETALLTDSGETLTSLNSKINELMAKCRLYESTISDLKQQITKMRDSNIIFTEEVHQQEEMQSDLFEEVNRLHDENHSLRSFISESNSQNEPETKGHVEDDAKSIDSLDAIYDRKSKTFSSPYKNDKAVEDVGFERDWDSAARQSLDSLDGDIVKSYHNDGERSVDSLDDVSSLCDQMYVTAQSEQISKHNLSIETVMSDEKRKLSEKNQDNIVAVDEDGLPLEEKVYQLEMEKILLKAKVSKLEEELDKRHVTSSQLGPTVMTSSWVWDSDSDFKHHRRSSSGSVENAKRRTREGSSMVESSSTLTSNSAESLENLLDARFREKTAVRYPTMHMQYRTSSSPSPARESSSFPRVFEERIEDKRTEEDLFSPSSIHSLDLTDELDDLSREMKETQDIYVREKALLQEALDREQEHKEEITARIDSKQIIVNEGSNVDVEDLKQKLAMSIQTNKFLLRENEEWIHRVKKQEALVFQLRERLADRTSVAGDFQDVFGQQLALLQDHRNELLNKLDEKMDGEKLLAQMIGEKSILEENLRQEKELLAEKIIDKNILESQLLELKLDLERTSQEQRFLEEKLYQKDKTEKQLMRQKRMLEEELYEIETKLKEREATLELEKGNLLRELKEKDLAIRRYEARRNSSSLMSGMSSPRLSTSLLSVASSESSSSKTDAGGKMKYLEKVREEIEEKHRDAIDLLRHQLKVSHSVEELRLREQHTADLSSLSQRHKQQLESVKGQYEGLMDQLASQLTRMQQPETNQAGDMETQSLLQQKLCQQMLEKLKVSLTSEQNNDLDTLMTSLESEHHKRLETLNYQHAEDMVLQLQAMRITVEQVESSRCEVLRIELQKETLHKLANQREELAEEYEQKIQSMEKSWSDRLDKLQKQLNNEQVAEQDPGNTSKALIVQLEKQLQEEHNLLLQKLDQDPLPGVDDGEDDLQGTDNQFSSKKLLKLCSQLAMQCDQLETLSESLKEHHQNKAQMSQSQIPESPEQAVTVANSSEWEVEMEDDSQDFSESDHGEFVLDTSVQNTEELSKKIKDYENKLRDYNYLKDALEESDKQVKELVNIVNAKDELLSKLQGDTNINSVVTEYENKFRDFEEKISSLEEHLETSEKQNFEVSEKLETQIRLYKELEQICQTQDTSLQSEKERVGKLNCDIQEKDLKILTLEQKLGINSSICDRTLDSEVPSTDTSLSEIQDDSTRVLKDLERRHAEEMEDLTQMYNEEQENLRENLKIARAKEVELSEQLDDLAHKHQEALDALREELLHEQKVEVESLQSQFDAQLQVEIKHATADLESNDKTLAEKQMADYCEISNKQSSDTAVTNDHHASVEEVTAAHEDRVRALVLEWEEKVEKTRLELEEQFEDEKSEMDRRHQQEVDNLQTQLRDAQEKLANIIEALDSGDFDSPALEAYRTSLKEKVDLELEMARQVLQDEYEEQTTSLEEYTAEEAAKEQAKFIEQHQKMMDDFIAEKEREREELNSRHADAIHDLQLQLQEEKQRVNSQGQSSQGQSSHEESETNLRSKVECLQKQLEDKEIELEKKLSEIEASRELEINQIKEDYENKLEVMKKDFKTSHEDQLEAVAMDTDVVQSDLDKAHEQELNDLEERLTEKHGKELGNLEKQLMGRMEQLLETHQEEIERLKKEHKSELNKLRKELSEREEIEEDQNTPPPKEILEEFSTVSESHSLTQYPLGDSDIEIEYESSFIESEEEGSEEGVCSRTPTQMMDTLSFEEAEKLAYTATVTAPNTSISAPPSEDIEEEIEEEITEAAEEELAQLDQVLLETLAKSEVHSPKSQSPSPTSPQQDSDVSQFTSRITELESEVSHLQKEFESKVQETEWLQRQLVQQSTQYQELRVRLLNYEHLEGESLVNMLRTDADRLGQERDSLQKANEHLLQLLSNSLRLYQTTEENITKALVGVVSLGASTSSSSTSAQGESNNAPGSETNQLQKRDSHESLSGLEEVDKGQIIPDAAGDRFGSPDSDKKSDPDTKDSQSSEACQNTSLLSVGTDEGLDLSSRLTEIMFVGPDIDREGEELLRDGSTRLQSAVSSLLEMIGDSSEQLREAQRVQQELLQTLTAKTEETEQLIKRCHDLDENLKDETNAKEYLATELNKAEGLLEGYVAENGQLQKKLEESEEKVMVLAMNLEAANTKIQDLENARQEVDAMRLEVEHQQSTLQSGLGTESQDHTSETSADVEYVEEPALMQEINKLNQEKRDMTKQRDKDGERRGARIRDLEMTVEEMEKRYEDMLDEKKRENDELLLKVESLDNKLKSSRNFIDEQANDREQEREEHQREVRRLTQVIQEKEKRENVESRLQREVNDLMEEIQIKNDLMNESTIRNEQLQMNLKEKHAKYEELDDNLKHAERELEEKTLSEKLLQQKIARLEEELKQDSSASDDTESKRQPVDDDLKQKILILEQELEAKERTIYHDKESLEEELRQARRLEEELTNEKEALQKQVYENLHQISQLRTQLDEYKHRYDPNYTEHIATLKHQLGEEREVVERKEKEVNDLVNQVEQLREQAMDSDEHLQQITNQLKISEKQLESLRSEQNQSVKDLIEENKKLKVKFQEFEHEPSFQQSLLDEKNDEIDHLSNELERLRTDQSTVNEVTTMKAMVDSIRLELEQKSRDVEELQNTIDNFQHSDALLDTTVSEGDLPPMPSLTERMSIQDEFSNALAIKDDEVLALQSELEQKHAELSQAKIELETSCKVEPSPLNEALLQEKDTSIEQLTLQVEGLHTEINNLTDFQAKLQEDYDMVQAMLEEKQKEIESLTKELTETRPQAEGATDALMKFEIEVDSLKKQLKEKDNVIDEKEEELYTLNEKVEEKETEMANLQKLIKEKEELLAKLNETPPGGEEHSREATEVENLKELISEKEKSVDSLKKQLEEQACEQEEALTVLRSQLEIAAKALEERDNQVEKLTQALGDDDVDGSLDGERQDTAVTSLKEQLREAEQEKESLEEDKEFLSRELDAFKLELSKYKQDMLSHQAEASEKTAEVEQLKEKLHQVQKEAERIEVLTAELNRTKSQLQLVSASNSVLSLDGATEEEVHQLTEELQKARIELEVFKASASESASQVEQKLEDIQNQLQKEHSENIRELKQDYERDVEIKLSELSRQHKQELDQLEEIHRKEVERAVREACRETEKMMNEDRNVLIQRHNEEIKVLRAKLTAATEDVAVMEVQQQLQSEVATTERLDSRLLEHLSRPRQDGVGHDNPDVPFAEPPLDTVSEETVPDRLRVLMNRLHNEGVQMLTLSELQFLKRHSSPPRLEKEVDISALQSAWENEKQGLLSAIQALKDLLAQIHTSRESEQITELGVSDWRNDLIAAISRVYAKERETLLAELRTQVVAAPSTELSTLQRLEQKIRDQGEHHHESMNQMYSVDRQSLLSEIRDLRSHASITRLQLQDEKQRLSQQLSSTEEQLSKRDHQLRRQVELLEYKLKQEQVIQDDLRASLSGETTRLQELQSLLGKEQQTTLDLQMELSEAQMQIDRLNDSLQQEENRLKTVSDAIENERVQRNKLADQLEESRSECRRLQRVAQEEKRKVGQLQDNEVNLLQTLQVELEKEKDLHAEVVNNLDREKLVVENLRRELQFEKDNLHAVESQFKSRLNQLQSHLEAERERCQELHGAISREQALNNKLRSSLEEERGSVQASSHREQTIISDLKALLQTERGRVEELQAAVDRDRSQVTTLNNIVEETKHQAREDVDRERNVCRELKKQLDIAQEQALQLSRQHEVDTGRINMLEHDHTELRSEIRSLKTLESERVSERETERQSEVRRVRQLEQDREDKATRSHEKELEVKRLKQKVSDLELQLTSLRSQSSYQRQSPRVQQATSPRFTDLTDDSEDRLNDYRCRMDRYKTQLEASRQRLHLLLLKHQDDLNRSESSMTYSELSARKTALGDLMGEIEQLQRPLALESESRPTISSSPSMTAINDRVMKHNTELTGFIARLSQEKAELRQNVARLEDDLRQAQEKQAQLQSRGRVDLSESMVLAERASWNQERITLQMSLDHAEREVDRLKSDLRAEQHRALRLTTFFTSESDSEKIQRLYGKYLRCESFRKALIYQKRYLLLLLGGFQDCEETTLAIIARMGVYPSVEDVQRRSRHSKAFSTFRTAARVVVAIHRMQYLVKKWKRATKVGSPVVTSNQHLQHGYMATANTYSPPRLTNGSHSLVESHSQNGRENHVYISSSSSSRYLPSRSPRIPSLSVPTPPTRDRSKHHTASENSLRGSPSIRRELLSDFDHKEEGSSRSISARETARNGTSSSSIDQSMHDDYITRLEGLQHRLKGLNDPGNLRSKPHWSSANK